MRKRLDIPPRNVWTVKEMADTLDVQYLTAKTWCTRRNIECEKLNNFLWVIPEKEVERLKSIYLGTPQSDDSSSDTSAPHPDTASSQLSDTPEDEID